MNVDVQPELLLWACERAPRKMADLTMRFGELPAWVSGDSRPTLRQVEDFAEATRTPVGFFFLAAPPVDELPIADLRVLVDGALPRPSACLLEAVFACQRQQDWYREDRLAEGHHTLPFVGSAQVAEAPREVATRMAHALTFDLAARTQADRWEGALEWLIERAEALGVLVMMKGTDDVLPHAWPTRDELTVFVLADAHAPLVFVNTAAAEAAQVLALAHGLARVWLGESGLSNACAGTTPVLPAEAWCHAVACALTAPLCEAAREHAWTDADHPPRAHVSAPLVAAIRVAAWEGRTSFTEAQRLLGGVPLEAPP